ncbi:hypothetical protein [Nocardia sp. NPDC046763]|uniref:hypothetical protein n=1 Tax=Nocardia sp. NPDC046763 TaxID=3155256 RepID=UPI0033FEC770
MIMTLATVAPTPAIEPCTFDRTVTRLCAEFGSTASRQQVESVLRWSLADLAGSPAGAMPELGERSARQRLLDNDLDMPLHVA